MSRALEGNIHIIEKASGITESTFNLHVLLCEEGTWAFMFNIEMSLGGLFIV